MCICIRTSIDVYISLFFPSNNYRIFNTDQFNREKSRCIKIVLRYSSTIFRAIFFPLAEEIDVWIESFTFRDTSMFGGVGRGGEGKNKNRRPIESGAINGSRHCSPRFQVKFARIKNGAIVYRNSLFVFFFFTFYAIHSENRFCFPSDRYSIAIFISIIGPIQSFEFYSQEGENFIE